MIIIISNNIFNNHFNNPNFNNHCNNHNFNNHCYNHNFNNHFVFNNNFSIHFNNNFKNHFNNYNNFSNHFNNNNFNNDFNNHFNNNNFINEQNCYLNQIKLIPQNNNNSSLVEFKYDNLGDIQNMIRNQNINFSTNSSLVSISQCDSTCLDRRYNLKFLPENFIRDNIFLLDIANIFEKLSKILQKKQSEIDFTNSIQSFINQAKIFKCIIKTDKKNPFQPLFIFCKYLELEYRKHILYINKIFREFTKIEILPKNKFRHIYDTINYFNKNLYTPIVGAFYYILINLTRCPTCNNILKVDFRNEDDISNFNKISNLNNNSLSKQKKSNENYECDYCCYEGPGKNEIRFLNTQKYLLARIEGKDKEIKNIDNTLYKSKFSLTNIGKKKDKLFCLVQTYTKTSQHEYLYSTENSLTNNPAANASNKSS